MAVTTELQLPLPEQNQANNAANIGTALQYLNDVIAMTGSVALSSSDVTLTEAQARNGYIELTGTLTANVQVKVPQRSRMQVFFNNTSGAFTVTIIPVTSGTGVAITQGKHTLTCMNGTNVIKVFVEA